MKPGSNRILSGQQVFAWQAYYAGKSRENPCRSWGATKFVPHVDRWRRRGVAALADWFYRNGVSDWRALGSRLRPTIDRRSRCATRSTLRCLRSRQCGAGRPAHSKASAWIAPFAFTLPPGESSLSEERGCRN